MKTVCANTQPLVPSVPSDARLRRAQALAHSSGAALRIAREQISRKLAGQERVARESLVDDSSMFSTATIHSFEQAPFDNSSDVNFCGNNPLTPTVQGCMHQFSSTTVQGEKLLPASAYPVLQNQAIFSSAASKLGIGDVIFRGKFQAIRGEKAGLAVGVDLHTPTGDELNLQGSGTWGTRPFVVFSYSGRVAPHASFGYQINGNSILAGDVTKDVESHSPNVITYDAGADIGISPRISVSGDFLGQALLNQKKITQTTFVDFAGSPHPEVSLLLPRRAIKQASR